MTIPASPILTADRVTFAYDGTLAVQDASLALSPGEILAIVGPNGCGKSTLLALLTGHLSPQSGQVTLHPPLTPQTSPLKPQASSLSPLPSLSPVARARLLALAPQNASVGFDYSVRQMVLMARWPTHASSFGTSLGFETADDHRLANEAMWTMDVHHLADRPVTRLSGGERQRVIIARALAQQTPILMLDEPTSALDVWHQLELLAHLRTLADAGSAVIIVTHDLNHARTHADRVLLMDAGRIVAAGAPGEVLTPANLEPVYRVRVTLGDPHALAFTRQPPPQ